MNYNISKFGLIRTRVRITLDLTKSTLYGTIMNEIEQKTIKVIFFKTATGNEPVREWLKSLSFEDRKMIGFDIKTIEFGWPLGMPLCRSLSGYKGLWEVRSKLTHEKIARILFFIDSNKMVLLHGFIKKTQKTPESDLSLAMKRKKDYEQH